MSYTGLQQPAQAVDGSTVATPPTGYGTPFVGTDGGYYLKLDDGSVVELAATSRVVQAVFVQDQAVTVANTTTETTLLGTGVGSLSIPANFFIPGTTLELQGWGFHSGISTPTIRIRAYLGSTLILDTTAVNSSNSTNAMFQLRAAITCYTDGASGSIYAQGFYQESGAGSNNFQMVNSAPITLDTTVAQVLNVTIQWGAASPSNTITMTNFNVKNMT